MTATRTPVQHNANRSIFDACSHRVTCILTGGLAITGAALALLVHPWFVGLAAAAGLWLIFAAESKGSPASTAEGSEEATE